LLLLSINSLRLGLLRVCHLRLLGRDHTCRCHAALKHGFALGGEFARFVLFGAAGLSNLDCHANFAANFTFTHSFLVKLKVLINRAVVSNDSRKIDAHASDLVVAQMVIVEHSHEKKILIGYLGDCERERLIPFTDFASIAVCLSLELLTRIELNRRVRILRSDRLRRAKIASVKHSDVDALTKRRHFLFRMVMRASESTCISMV
jgi:hypothetical protein